MADSTAAGRHLPILAELLDRMPIGIGVFDTDLRVRDFNHTMAAFVARFAPVTFEQIVPGATLQEVSPQTADYLEPLFRRALKGETVRRDAILLIADGEETFWDLVFQPLIEDGQITGVIDITTEATARVRASKLADLREQQFRQVFESTGDGIIINDPETELVVEVNPAACRMHGYTREEFIGLHPTAFIHPDSLPIFGEYLTAVRSGQIFRARANDIRKDGTLIPIEVSGSMGEYQGRPHLVAVVRDIGEQMRTEQVLEQRVLERTRELEMLLDVSGNIASTRNLEHMLALILRRLRPVVNYAAAAVFLLEPGGTLRLLQHTGPTQLDRSDQLSWLATTSEVAAQARSRTPHIIADVYAEEASAVAFRAEAVEQIGHIPGYVGTWMGVPLLFNDRILGVLGFLHSQSGYYTEQHAALALAFANQAAAAIDNARLFDELTTNSRELTTLLSVASSLSSTLEFDRLVDLVLDQLKHLIDYTGCGLVRVVDGNEIVVVSARSMDGKVRPVVTGLRMKLQQPGDLWHRVLSGEPVIIDDVRGETVPAQQYRAVVGSRGDTVFEAVRSWMAIPLMVNDQVFGMLTVSRDIPGFFTDHDRQLAEALAGQASIALSNAVLFAEAEARTRELSTLLEVSRNITSTLELRPLLSEILEQLRLTLDYAGATVFEVSGSDLRALAARRTGEAASHALRTYPLSSTPVNQRVMDQKRPLIIDDIHADSPVAQTLRSAWDEELQRRLANVHSWLGVPLVAKDRVIGMLSVEHHQAGHFKPEHASLAMAFANQAATAIENARLFEQSQKRANQMEALSRIASTLALDEPTNNTLDAIAEQVVRATRALGCSVILIDGDIDFELYGSAGITRELMSAMYAAIRAGARSPTVSAWGSHERRVVRDARRMMLNEPLYAPAHPLLRDSAWDSVVIVPMIYHGAALGTLNTYYEAGYEPDAEELALVSAIADQASVAIDNRRLFGETERRAREVDALYRADERLHQSLLLSDVLDALVDVTTGILQADKSLVVIRDQKSGRLHVAAHRGYSESTIVMANQAMTTLTPGGFMVPADAVAVEDADNDRRAIRQVVDPEGIRSFVDVPIAIAGQTFGIVDLAYTSPRRFSPDDLRLFTAFAQRAGVAIENARLYERSQRAASLEERQRLARELHDSVSQALYGIALGARTARTQLDRDPARVAEPLDYVLSLAEAGLAELRSLIFELRPESLETEGLAAAFNKQFAAVRARHGIEVTADFGDEPLIAVEEKEALYRIGQEAINNTVKHARATKVNVRMTTVGNEVQLTVEDNGIGFDPGGDFPGHMGLQSMAERAAAMGAVFEIESSPGAGAIVRVRLLLAAAG